MTLTVLNDVHIGATRSAGTTPQTAYQLRQDLLANLEDVTATINTDLLINGDLFDGPDIPRADMLATKRILSNWVKRIGKRLILSNGNHDLSKNSTQLSSFQLLAMLLVDEFPDEVIHVQEPQSFIGGGFTFHVIPHLGNQDLFDQALKEVQVCDYLFVHANYDNGFAVEKDHSLNLSRDQAEALPVKYIVFGHEHQGRTALDGKVVIVGNQFPSSVSDCLGEATKRYMRTGEVDGQLVCIMQDCWKAEGDYSEQDWRSLEDTGRFIRVVGTATAAEAAKMQQTLAKFRAKAKALVITNAVRTAGVNDADELVLTAEEITNFNVRAALADLLTPEENAKVDRVLGITNNNEKEVA